MFSDQMLQQYRSYEALEEMAIGILRSHPKKMLCESDLKKQIVRISRYSTDASRTRCQEVGQRSRLGL